MGTNYYAKIDICPACERPQQIIHLGKSSYGWKFMFAYNGGIYYKNVKEMKKFLVGKLIESEYGDKVSPAKFWKMIEEKQKAEGQNIKEGGFMQIEGYEFLTVEFS